MIEAVITSKMSVNFYESARHSIPEDISNSPLRKPQISFDFKLTPVTMMREARISANFIKYILTDRNNCLVHDKEGSSQT
jgi:hypothetical protein